MNTVVTRVARVLRGHSPTALIHAVEKNGQEHKLEVPVESTRDVTVGQILVLQWSVHDVPEVATQAVEVVPLVEPAPAARPTAVSGVLESASSTSDNGQLEALLGLRPGRLRGSGPPEYP